MPKMRREERGEEMTQRIQIAPEKPYHEMSADQFTWTNKKHLADKLIKKRKYYWCGVDIDVMTNKQLRDMAKIIADKNDGSVKQLIFKKKP